MQKYSSSELHELRNKISLRKLLGILNIEVKLDGEVEIFSCPRCSGFRTGINPRANLCRCFSCARNFNPIELVMEHQKASFLASVKYLKQHFDKLVDLPSEASTGDKRLKTSVPSTSSGGSLSSLEQQLVALATPKRSQCPLGKSA